MTRAPVVFKPKVFFLWLVIFAITAIVPNAVLAQSKRGKLDQSEMTVKIKINKRTFVGNPLLWDGADLQLLRRDGRITTVPVASHDDYEVLPQKFAPYSRLSMARRLQNEFGSKYKVSMTPNFLVVHPQGDYHTWAKPFEDLNTRFEAYFQTRGTVLKKSEFPMVAVVLRTRREFDRMLSSYHKSSLSKNTLGYYSPRSNRVITYDPYDGKRKNWLSNTDTIVHEATHQTAFNRGVHSRFVNSARWVSEGLACMFEAPGVNNSYVYTRQKDRVNLGRMTRMLDLIESRAARGKLEQIVRDDQLFRTQPQLAYAYAWSLTFFLAETKPREYIQFLTRDGQRENYSAYSKTDRVEQFAKAFGSDFGHLEAQMFQYLKRVKLPTNTLSQSR